MSIRLLVGVVSLIFIFTSCGGSKSSVDDIVVVYDDVKVEKSLLPVQIKYGKLLNIKPDSLQNVELYHFIDKWINTPYRLGGETSDGIDCSSFTQLLYTEVFDKYIERTAEKQFESRAIKRFRGKEFLQEGDFVFFQSKNEVKISHVGIFLKNNKFVHSTSYKGKVGSSGVKVSNINDPHWSKYFVAGGKRVDL
ncbi:glycoside hydrolase [Aquimarina sp. AD10]|uniref:NlpC/P60 domain-containing protein n=1 Tax=Aquimarina aggregata TaxID=1642818 RepID=A0A162CL94_9FLAO|nr:MULTISPECIES: NlpC/P60 family protein [Aquimarina]AXT60415.1 glycoside hydrolase [Aquimarina sp. AD10]KZS38934.1 hypothetical protein AWE51_15240 [Aquimarina aggregata]RKN01150.1 glycoside hydrolase [Aquimarina sp. AD10]